MAKEQYLEFERPVLNIAARMRELEEAQATGQPIATRDIKGELATLEIERVKVLRHLYRQLSPWQKVQVARHPARPQPRFYIKHLLTDFQELAGDRQYADDAALVGGIGQLAGQTVMILATDKGSGTQERMAKNFGMPRPEGYRKAQRLMRLAQQFGLPIITLVDTPGAYPGVDAEARGQAEAIARCIEISMGLDTPLITLITGEGGSGGALALAAADKVIMLEHSIYSVISPEGCASILWREATKETVPQAADALQLTAQSAKKHGLIDHIIKEPVGAAHRNPQLTLQRVKQTLTKTLDALNAEETGSLKISRREKFSQF